MLEFVSLIEAGLAMDWYHPVGRVLSVLDVSHR